MIGHTIIIGAIPYVFSLDNKAETKTKFCHDKEMNLWTDILFDNQTKQLQSGEVGAVVATIRDMAHNASRDTITTLEKNAIEPLRGYGK